jgi:hypothetical protein
LERRDGFLRHSREPGELGEVGVKLRDLRLNPGRMGGKINRGGELTLLPGQDAEKAERSGLMGLLLEDLPADIFRLDEFAGAVEFLRGSKRILNRCSVHQ